MFHCLLDSFLFISFVQFFPVLYLSFGGATILFSPHLCVPLPCLLSFVYLPLTPLPISARSPLPHVSKLCFEVYAMSPFPVSDGAQPVTNTPSASNRQVFTTTWFVGGGAHGYLIWTNRSHRVSALLCSRTCRHT